MTWLSENPWPLAGGCVVLTAVFLVMLKLTTQGRFLVFAGVALAMAGVVLLVEHFWTTDRERIAGVLYDMADAVEQSEFDRLEAHLSSEFRTPGGMITMAMMRGTLEHLDFEFIRLSKVTIEAGRLTGRGKADFLAQAAWEEPASIGRPDLNATPPPGVGFSVGFRREPDGEWTVTRIDVISAPGATDPNSVAAYIGRFARSAS